MGTDNPSERDLHQGLIKLAAAFVHATRGNRLGIEKNLRGARELLTGGIEAGTAEGIDVSRIIAAIDDRLARISRSTADARGPRIAPTVPDAPADSTGPIELIEAIPIFSAKSTPGDD